MIGFYGIKDGKSFFYLPFKFTAYGYLDKDKKETVKISWDSKVMWRLASSLEKECLSRQKLEDNDWMIYEADIDSSIIKQFNAYHNTRDYRTFDCALEILEDAEYLLGITDTDDSWWKYGGEPPGFIPIVKEYGDN